MPKLYSWIWLVLGSLFVFGVMSAAQAAEKAAGLKITHSPATFAVKGQPLTLRARVTGGAGGVENVTLYYALFRDAAPFRVTMTSSGMDMYVGTIEAGLLSGLNSISYYIEAQDRDGSIEETPWYDVQFKDPDASAVPVAGAGGNAKGGQSPPKEEGMSAMTIGLIAGGAAAVAAGAYFLADSGGGDDNDNGGGGGTNTNQSPVNAAGTYSGVSTVCLTVSNTTCDSKTASIVIDSNGRVFSDTLVNGTAMSGNLRGSDFVLTAPVSNTDPAYTGTIAFNGTVINGARIVGNVSGTVDQGGAPGTFTGSFSMNK